MSEGCPMRPSGVMAIICFSKSLPTPITPAARAPSLAVAPGLMEFTRICLGPNSFASTRVIASRAPLGCRVDRQVGRGQLRRHRADVDDAATPRPEILDGLTDHQKGTQYVRVELPVEFFLGHRF